MKNLLLIAAALCCAPALAQDAAVKKAIQAKYTVFGQSAMKRDFAKMYSICAPDFQWISAKGKPTTVQEVQKAAAEALTPLPPLTGASTTISGLKVKGDTATLENLTNLVVEGPPDEKGKRLKMELQVSSSDTWKKVGGDWKWSMAKEKSIKRLMNGVEFGKPAAPTAPAKPKGKG